MLIPATLAARILAGIALMVQDAPSVTYLANEGVLIRGRTSSVMIDGLIRDGLPDYESIPIPHRAVVEGGRDPYRVDLVLATHVHRDHFNADAVAGYLRSVPGARFAGPAEALDSVTAMDGSLRGRMLAARDALPGFVRALDLPHGTTRVPVENVGYIVEIDGVRFLHTGDAAFSPEDWERIATPGRIDVALVPYWYLMNEATRQVLVERIRPRAIVLLHKPAAGRESGTMRALGGWAGFVDSVARSVPVVVAPGAPLTQVSIPRPVQAGPP